MKPMIRMLGLSFPIPTFYSKKHIMYYTISRREWEDHIIKFLGKLSKEMAPELRKI